MSLRMPGDCNKIRSNDKGCEKIALGVCSLARRIKTYSWLFLKNKLLQK